MSNLTTTGHFPETCPTCSRAQTLEAALVSIKRAAPACECEHDNEYCCAVVGEFCGYCWAHAALISSANSSPSDAEQLMELRKLAQSSLDLIVLLARRLQTSRVGLPPGGEDSGNEAHVAQVVDQLRAALNPSHLQKETQK